VQERVEARIRGPLAAPGAWPSPPVDDAEEGNAVTVTRLEEETLIEPPGAVTVYRHLRVDQTQDRGRRSRERVLVLRFDDDQRRILERVEHLNSHDDEVVALRREAKPFVERLPRQVGKVFRRIVQRTGAEIGAPHLLGRCHTSSQGRRCCG
jgi:hypothetical protein